MAATLSDILLNPLLLCYTAPYLSLRSICVLIRTCRAFRAALLDNSRLYRYVNLEETILQMLKRVPEYEEIHEVPELSAESCPACGDACYSVTPDCVLKQVLPCDDAKEFSDRFEVIDKDCLFDLYAMPHYGVHELGQYIGITSEQIEIINSNKGALKRALSMPAIAILFNRLISGTRSPKSGKSGTSINSNNFYNILVDICVKLTRTALNVLVSGRQLIMYVRILVLDGIKLANCLVLHEVIHLVRRGIIPLSLLSIRETGMMKHKHVLHYIRTEIAISGMKDRQPPNKSTPPVLGIYLFGRKDSPSPHLRRLDKRKKKGKNHRNGENGEESVEPDDGVASVIGKQLGHKWQSWPQTSISNTDSQNRRSSSSSSSSNTSATYPAHDWYRRKGEMIHENQVLDDWALEFSLWKNLMSRNEQNEQDEEHATVGLRVALDAVLCPGPRHDWKWVEFMREEQAESRDEVGYILPRIATVALGPDGCHKCGSCPERAESWPESPIWELPLLSPVPKFETSVRNAQCPWRKGEEGGVEDCEESKTREGSGKGVKLIVRCQQCLVGQYDKLSKKWECEYCYFGVVYGGELDT